MINRRVATVIAGVAGGLAVLLGAVLLVAWRMDERRDARRAEHDAAMQLQLAADQDRTLFAARERQADAIDWAEVTAAFTGAHPPTADEAAEFAPLFAALGRALDRDDQAAAGRLCDPDRLVTEVIGARARANAPTQTRAEVEVEFRDEFEQVLIRNRALRWQRTDVRRVRWLAERSEALVYVVHRPAAGESFKALWWVVKRDDGWKVFDTADVYLASRFTRDPLTLNVPEVIAANVGGQDRYGEARSAISVATRVMNTTRDVDEADLALAPARGLQLAAEDAAVLAILEGRILSDRLDIDAALQCFDEAERLVPGLPAALSFRASTCNGAGRYAEALIAIRDYQARVGPDGHSLQVEGFALEGLGRRAEALVAYRKGLDDNADDVPALLGLRRVLPDDQKREIADRFAKTTEPRKAYDALIAQALQDNDETSINLLLDAFRKLKPDDPRGLGDDIRRKVKAEKFADALDLLTHGLKAKEERDRDAVLFAYLHAMFAAGKSLEAYAAVPAPLAVRAFRALAGNLTDAIELADGNAAERARQLTELVATHRKREPNDPWAWYYEAEVFWHAKEYEKAEKALAAGAAKLPPPKVDVDPFAPAFDPDGREWEAEQFRARRVACLFKLKQDRAAHRDIGPVESTFRQLADLYDITNDLAGLGELLGWHRARLPDDPEIVFWQAHLHFRKDNLAVAIPLFKSYLRDTEEKGPRTWHARDELIRALVRTKPADAARMARDLSADKMSAALRAAVAAAADDREELERLLAECALNGKIWFYLDPDFRHFFGQEKYRDLRAKYPDPTPPPKMNG